LSNNAKIGGRMSLTVAIEIPREVLHAARMTPEEMKRELAVLLFQQAVLWQGAGGRWDDSVGLPTTAWQQRDHYPL
jgi:hypothetical protein